MSKIKKEITQDARILSNFDEILIVPQAMNNFNELMKNAIKEDPKEDIKSIEVGGKKKKICKNCFCFKICNRWYGRYKKKSNEKSQIVSFYAIFYFLKSLSS